MYRRLFYVLLSLLFVLFITSCSQQTLYEVEEEPVIEENEEDNEFVEPIEEQEEQEPEPEVIEQAITVSAIGDILIHSRVYNDARVDGGFDFTPMFEQVAPYLRETTITFANQETMIGGEEIGLSTYPAFNSPYEVGDALKDAGVNVVSIANNHTLDRGEKAIQNALRHWETIDMMYVGAYKDQLDRETLRLFETDEGITVAFLAYTYGTNGIPIPDGKDFLVNLIDREVMLTEITQAKEVADAVILSLHFGNEYERMPSDEQKDLVQFAADLGVDVILGHHPHVLQPMAWVTGANGNQTLVAYSLGNFLSGQDKYYRQVGGMAKFTIHKRIEGEDETVSIVNPQFMPTYVKSEAHQNYRVIPMFKLTDNDLPNAASHYEEIKAHMSQWLPELEFIEE